MIAFDDVLIELQSFLQSKIDVDHNKPCSNVSSMLYACIVQDAVLPSRSCQDPYDFSSMGSEGRKNTVYLLLEL